MSYILEALRRADAERSQTTGAAPSDLTARSPGPDRIAPRRFRAAHGVGLGLAALAVALAGRWLFSDNTTEAPARPAPARVETPEPVDTPTPTPAATEPPGLPGAPGRAPPDTPRSEETPPAPAPRWSAPVTEPVPPILSPEPATLGMPRNPVERSDAASREPGPAAPGDSAMPAQIPTPPPHPTPRPPAASPPAPASGLKVTGATYSDNPAHRMLIINGRVVLEGQEVEPGLTLEVITPHSAVLNRQGTRFNINY